MKVKGCASRPRQHFKGGFAASIICCLARPLTFIWLSRNWPLTGSLLEGISSSFFREATNHISSRFLREATGTLLKHHLLDELRFSVQPVIVGRGKLLFREGETATLELVSARPRANGVVVLSYKPVSPPITSHS